MGVLVGALVGVNMELVVKDRADCVALMACEYIMCERAATRWN